MEKEETIVQSQPSAAREQVRNIVPGLIDLSERVLFGEVWERPGLSKRDRSLITCATLIALGREKQLVGHLQRALDNGLTKNELSEVITHLAFYAGWPAAMTAALVAKDVFGRNNAGDTSERPREGEMKIGFIGLGMMGSGMAANLQKAGHDLVVHDLRRAAAEPYLAAGAVWADSARAVAEASELVFTSLPGPPEVEAVALGDNGILSGMSRGKAYFDLSTNSPTVVRKINAAFAERDVYMLDSPVSGGPRGARTGKLALWVGGDEQIFNRHKPVLDAMGDKARYVGPIGAGSVAKLVHNGAGYCIQTALAEMFTVGVKAGVEPLALWEAVREGASGRRRTFDGLIDQFLPGKYEPAAFALRLAHKDMSLATQLGRDFNVPMRVANLALAELSEALNRGWGDRDFSLADAVAGGASRCRDPRRPKTPAGGARSRSAGLG